ncbi:MAG: hypothetical protein U0703_01675 [Anaerolineae bacterium]
MSARATSAAARSGNQRRASAINPPAAKQNAAESSEKIVHVGQTLLIVRATSAAATQYGAINHHAGRPNSAPISR